MLSLVSNAARRSVPKIFSQFFQARNAFHSLKVLTPIQQPVVQNMCRERNFLYPVTPLLNLFNGFKVKLKLKRRCKDCYFVVRDQRGYVLCPTHPRHKQMSMVKRFKNVRILTHATQSKIRPW